MMRDALLFLGSDFCSSDGHILVNLHAVRRNYVGFQHFGNLNREVGFPGGGRSDDE